MRYYVTASVISVISLISGVYLGVASVDTTIKSEYVPMLYTGSGFLISIVTLMIADRFSAAERQEASLSAIRATLTSAIPSVTALRRFDSADVAIKQITSSLPRARECWNTRMSPAGLDIGPERLRNFERCVSRCIRDGLIYHDIITSNHDEYRKRIVRNTQLSKGRYTCSSIEPGFTVINFIIIKFNDSEYDIYFGWPVGMASGAENSVFLSRDMRLVEYFLDYHQILARSGYIK